MKPMRIVTVLLLVATGVLLLVGPSSSDEPIGDPERVLVISVPTLTWDRIATESPPNITDLLSRAAVASASVRTIGADTDLAEGYATIGSGNRTAVPDGFGGLALPPDVEFDGEPVSDVYERRFGTSPEDARVLHIGAAAIQRRNDDLLYGAETGTLGEALREAGMTVGVVANGDLEAAPSVTELHREAALAAMDGLGRVPRGRVDGGLIDTEAATPSGLSLDPDEVARAAAAAWEESDLLVVELSDLLRAEATDHLVTPEVSDRAHAEALRASDEMVGSLLEMVDLDRDLVMLVSPVSPMGADQLVVAAVAGAGTEPGLARSGTSRRDGYVTLSDMGPTVLQALDLPKPGAMKGAPIASAGGGAPDVGTFRSLADDNVRALFRNDLSGPLTVIFIVSQVLTYCLAAYALTNRRMRWSRTSALLLLAGMAVPFMSFFAGIFPYWRLGVGGALVAILAGAFVFAVAVRILTQRISARTDPGAHLRAIAAPLVVMGATTVLLVADIAAGGPLQIDTAFGYGGGAIVAGRLAGYGNLAWALMVTALIITVTGLWGRWRLGSTGEPSTTDRRFALAVSAAAFALAVLAVGLPTLGANVGGTISVVAGLCIVLLALADTRLDLRRLLGVGVVTAGVLAVFGAIDVNRSPEDQTHLGRLIDQTIGDEGIPGLATVLERKINANVNILFSSVWALVIPAALAFLAFLIWRPPQFLRTLFHHVPGMRACVIGVLATGVIGGVVNDSGIAIPAIMLTLLLPHVAYVIVEAHSATAEVTSAGPQT